MITLDNAKVCVLGLGYVGLPLAVELGKKQETVGFDINKARVEELQSGKDSTLEVEPEELAQATHLTYTSNKKDAKTCNVFIVTVPTPVDEYNTPDLSPLISASKMMGELMSKGDIAIFESTVYPGATEEVCVPVIEEVSGLKYNVDFFVGYSPERINPGDKEHKLTNTLKITAGSTPEAAKLVDDLYKSIVTAGTHLASSIKVAEAAKVIENTQRDLNIALVNELALIFNKLGIDTIEVLEAAGTKWNFLPFRPGLVGGHCIGVDPYYLTHKAVEIGYHPEVILAGRRINDNMGSYISGEVIKLMIKKSIQVVDSNILIMGLTFKENCPDLRNTRVIDIIESVREYNISVDVYDPWVNSEEAQHEYNVELIDKPAKGKYDAIILAVAHDQFIKMGVDEIRALGRKNSIIYDVKAVLPIDKIDARL